MKFLNKRLRHDQSLIIKYHAGSMDEQEGMKHEFWETC